MLIGTKNPPVTPLQVSSLTTLVLASATLLGDPAKLVVCNARVGQQDILPSPMQIPNFLQGLKSLGSPQMNLILRLVRPGTAGAQFLFLIHIPEVQGNHDGGEVPQPAPQLTLDKLMSSGIVVSIGLRSPKKYLVTTLPMKEDRAFNAMRILLIGNMQQHNLASKTEDQLLSELNSLMLTVPA